MLIQPLKRKSILLEVNKYYIKITYEWYYIHWGKLSCHNVEKVILNNYIPLIRVRSLNQNINSALKDISIFSETINIWSVKHCNNFNLYQKYTIPEWTQSKIKIVSLKALHNKNIQSY